MYFTCILWGATVGQTLLKLFLLPGQAAADTIKLGDEDSRGMIRLLVNMLFWNLVGLTVTVAVVT